jgi:hypothetical protein
MNATDIIILVVIGAIAISVIVNTIVDGFEDRLRLKERSETDRTRLATEAERDRAAAEKYKAKAAYIRERKQLPPEDDNTVPPVKDLDDKLTTGQL